MLRPRRGRDLPGSGRVLLAHAARTESATGADRRRRSQANAALRNSAAHVRRSNPNVYSIQHPHRGISTAPALRDQRYKRLLLRGFGLRLPPVIRRQAGGSDVPMDQPRRQPSQSMASCKALIGQPDPGLGKCLPERVADIAGIRVAGQTGKPAQRRGLQPCRPCPGSNHRQVRADLIRPITARHLTQRREATLRWSSRYRCRSCCSHDPYDATTVHWSKSRTIYGAAPARRAGRRGDSHATSTAFLAVWGTARHLCPG